MIGLYIVTSNRLELFKQCVESIKSTIGQDFTAFILDNASDIDISQQIQEICRQNDWQFMVHRKHLGFAESFNICIKSLMKNEDIDYLIHCHDDVIFKPNWLDNILNVMKWDHRVWCACPEIRYGGFDGLAEFEKIPIPEIKQYPNYHFSENMYTACSVFIRSCFEIVGLYDEQFVDSAEDTDYYYRLLVAHRPQAEVVDAKMYHLRTGGIEGNEELMRQRKEKYERSEKLIRKKWQNVKLEYKTNWTYCSIDNPLEFPKSLEKPDCELAKIYNTDFFNYQKVEIPSSAKIIVDLVTKLCKPSSVIDVGGYIGIWLQEFVNHGISDVIGIDGDHVTDDMILLEDKGKIIRHDLTLPFFINRKFDVALMLEVAEHIDKDYEDVLFNSLFALSDVIVFSSNYCMSGTHHVNCNYEEYWDSKFITAGYIKCDFIRPLISHYSEQEIKFYYKNATILYTKPDRYKEIKSRWLDIILDNTFDQYDCHQNREELKEALGIIYESKPKTILEIGRKAGGTLYPLIKVADRNAIFLSIDKNAPSESFIANFDNHIIKGKQSLMYITGDSTSSDIIKKTSNLLKNRPADILFVDGSHFPDDVKSDHDNYSKMVKRHGGLELLHDIAKTKNAISNEDVNTLWNELKVRYKTKEIIGNNPNKLQGWNGIGIIYY